MTNVADLSVALWTLIIAYLMHSSMINAGNMWWLKKNDDRLYMAVAFGFPMVISTLPWATDNVSGAQEVS